MKEFTLNTHHAYLNNDIIIKCKGPISIVDKVTGKEYHFTDELKTRLCAGKHVFANISNEGNNTNDTNNQDLTLIGQYTIAAYKEKFNTSKLNIVEGPKKKGSLFFACGVLPNGQPNYGVVGQKAKALIEAKADAGQLRVSVYKTHDAEGKEVVLPILQANTKTDVDNNDGQDEEVFIEDAIKLGGGRIKNAFVFDDNPWVFVTTKDRLYIYNKETKEEKVEFCVTPDDIRDLGQYYDSPGKPCDFFLFQTKSDFAIYDVLRGRIVFSFVKHLYCNSRLVIYETDDGVAVYDYRFSRNVLNFKGRRYSFGDKFYYIDEGKLFGMNTSSAFINNIDFAGEIGDSDILFGNHLLKLEKDLASRKEYAYISLGNGERGMIKTTLAFPYYIDSWAGYNTISFQKAKEQYLVFKEENKKTLSEYPNIKSGCMGLRIKRTIHEWEGKKRLLVLYGEIIAYPALKHSIPFVLKGIEGETLDYSNAMIEPAPLCHDCAEIKLEDTAIECELNNGERLFCKSSSGNLLITKEDNKLYLRDIKDNCRHEILNNSFDSSSYTNAYFTSDGKSVVVQLNNNEGKIFGFEDLNMTHFDVEGFTVARNEGFNGYKPEISVLDGRKPVWRDTISLARISEKDMSKHIFMSPDGKYFADTSMKTVYYNRLEEREMTIDELHFEKDRYDWKDNASDQEKKDKIVLRKELLKNYEKDLLFKHLLDHEWEKRETENLINYYLERSATFTPLFIDRLGYVCYRKKQGEEHRILIGRSVWFLNYVSFSYDSKYLAFGAKMKEDEFRHSEEGVFVLFDLEREEETIRQEKEMLNDCKYHHGLYAVWMTMFNKTGDVAYYDSHPNAYFVTAESNYKEAKKAQGKSLLCFSPTGKYMALSDQSYIDYAHHPESNWGHQPSGNVFVHSTDSFDHCLEQYNDLGDGIEGVARQAGSVASAAFSQDERRLLVVGNDGVVVVRNLKNTGRAV